MKNIINRYKIAMNSEQGGPMVQTICAIGASLIILSGILYAGYCLLLYIGKAVASVNELNG